MTKPWCKGLEKYAVVVESGIRRVVMDSGLEKQYRKIAIKDVAALRRWMELWSNVIDGAIPDTRMKAQARFNDGEGRTVLIVAFKSFQARLYGFVRRVAERETFFITAIDPAKKDDEADPKILAKAKKEAFRVLDVLKIR